jgi:hypothetical protein
MPVPVRSWPQVTYHGSRIVMLKFPSENLEPDATFGRLLATASDMRSAEQLSR